MSARPMMVTTPETITVHETIVEAIASLDKPERDHGQLCPLWRHRRKHPTIWQCNCWRLDRITALADAICAALDGQS